MHIAFDCEWTGRKCEIVGNQLRRELITYGGISNVGPIEPIDAPPPAQKPRLSLICSNNSFGKKCGAAWEADVFTECPKCGQRRYVKKAEPAAVEASPAA